MVVDLVVSGYVVDVFGVCIRSGDDGVESWWYDTWWVIQNILFVARSLTRDVKGSIKCYLQYQLALIKWNNECWMEFCVFAEKISVLSYRVLRKKCKNYREVDFTYWNPGNVDIVTGFRSLKSSLWFCMKEYWMKRSLNPYEFLGHGSFYRLFLPWTQKFVI